MSAVTLGQVSGTLPNIAHYFSTLIFFQETYFELKGSFHSRYPSSKFFKQHWHLRHRRGKAAPDAIKCRIVAVLKRANVSVIAFRYMTTVCWNGAMRHVSSVEISAEDFCLLADAGMLRELHQVAETTTDEEINRHVIYGLSPVAMRIKNVVA